MTNVNPSPRTNALHTAAGVTPPSSEPTAFTAGQGIVYQNNGNAILRIVCTTAGTGTIVALSSGNNQSLTLPVGETLIGPLDPSIFGSTVTITTATAVGSSGLYTITNRFLNGLRNPFENSPTAADAN